MFSSKEDKSLIQLVLFRGRLVSFRSVISTYETRRNYLHRIYEIVQLNTTFRRKKIYISSYTNSFVNMSCLPNAKTSYKCKILICYKFLAPPSKIYVKLLKKNIIQDNLQARFFKMILCPANPFVNMFGLPVAKPLTNVKYCSALKFLHLHQKPV